VTPRRVVVVVSDLFFVTRIRGVAGQTGVEIETCASPAAHALVAARPPAAVILDLHGDGDPMALARTLKADPATAGVPLIGFYSHVDNDTRRRALEAGVDRVMPRSAFTAQLAAILSGGD
jgi:CheY-like chemotaxis protein